MSTAEGPVPRIDLIGLVVADMAASLAFYRRLGLELPADAHDQPHVRPNDQTGPAIAQSEDP